jgi:protein SCO1
MKISKEALSYATDKGRPIATKPHTMALALFATMCFPMGLATAREPIPQELRDVTVAEKLGKMLDLDLTFTDHRGKEVALRSLFQDQRPVLLTLNYYRCKSLCSLQLNSMVKGLKELGWNVGDKYRIVTVSIDPKESWQLGRDKRKSYLEHLGQPEADWTFMVGKQANIEKLAETVGFKYRYDKKQDQYAHPAVVFFISEKGKVSRYLYGLSFPARDIKFALVETSQGRVGSPIDKFILSCFHYDATLGRYGPFAFGIMRVGASVTAVGLFIFLAIYWRRENRRRRLGRIHR